MATILTLAHSPDADDAFMFYALARERVDTEGLRFQHVLEDIETLNQRARESTYDITAVSFHAYAYLPHPHAPPRRGARFGGGRGAAGVLNVYRAGVELVSVPFGEIPAAVAEGKVAAGVLIHEGQLTYAGAGLEKVLDLGAWWAKETGQIGRAH